MVKREGIQYMTDFEKIKLEIDKLSKEKDTLEKQIASSKTLQDVYVKELKEKYNITPEDVESEVLTLETKLSEMKTALEAKLTTLREYVSKLKTALAEA